MYQPKKIIIVGGNAAGPSAAAKAKRTNPDAEVLLFEAGEYISTGTCELPYLFSGEIKNYEEIVFFNSESFEKKKGVSVFINHLVKEIDRKQKKIYVIDKSSGLDKEFEYDKLILTTGSSPVEIPELPFSIENVFSLKSVGDFRNINNYILKNKVENILIIGAGYIGLELSDSLTSAGFNVSLYEGKSLPLPKADQEIRELLFNIIEESKINYYSGGSKTKFVVSDNKIKQFSVDGRFLEYDLAIVTAGIKPNNWLAENAALKIGSFGGLAVDVRLKTSDPNIYAAGDNIEIRNFVSRDTDYFPLATHAHNLGHIAGENAAGGNKISEPLILNATFKFLDHYIAQIGLNESKAKKYCSNLVTVNGVANNRVKVMPNSKKVFGNVHFDRYSGLIQGASFLGGEEVSGYADIISTMIQNKIPARNLSKIQFNYTPPLSPFVNLLSILGRKIEEKY